MASNILLLGLAGIGLLVLLGFYLLYRKMSVLKKEAKKRGEGWAA